MLQSMAGLMDGTRDALAALHEAGDRRLLLHSVNRVLATMHRHVGLAGDSGRMLPSAKPSGPHQGKYSPLPAHPLQCVTAPVFELGPRTHHSVLSRPPC